MFASTRQLTLDARAKGYAVPAVNIVDRLSINAVVQAADALGSPIILQTSVKTVRYFGAPLLAADAQAAADAASVPVALHLDHCPDREVITDTIANGWSSVLFDASSLPLDVAWPQTKEVCAEAHAAGVDVESELENIVGVEDGVGSDDPNMHYYANERLIEIAGDTGCDLLAPALGTAHGLYKKAPVLQFDRARQLAAMTGVPIVLHGGTGLKPEEFQKFIAVGISKINISTALKLVYLHTAGDHVADLQANGGKWEPLPLFDHIAADIKQMVADYIGIFGSAKQAKVAA
jgi:fructose-bisphosphate aldolase class II